MRISRLGKSATAVMAITAAVALSACQVTATGTGTVTFTADLSAIAFDGASPYGGTPGNTGDILAFCAAGVTCTPDIPGSILYWFKPAAGAMQAVFAPGTPVLNPAGDTVPLPVGSYRIEGIHFTDTNNWGRAETSDFIIGDSAPDLSTTMQSTARPSADATCNTGWIPSWAQWPNSGNGGYVCDRWIYTYYPDLPVATHESASTAPTWRQEIGRLSGDTSCSIGYQASWSQWPNGGTGGFVCTRES